MIGDEPKATQEVAKLGQMGIEAASDAGSFIARVFAGPIEHLAGALNVRALAYRIVNCERVIQKTRIKLRQLGVEDLKQISSRKRCLYLKLLMMNRMIALPGGVVELYCEYSERRQLKSERKSSINWNNNNTAA